MTKRPTTGNRLNPIDYFYLQTGNIGTVNNPSLLPEKTIDYEIGFQQVLNIRSSLKISGFYREQRNQVAQKLQLTEAACPGKSKLITL